MIIYFLIHATVAREYFAPNRLPTLTLYAPAFDGVNFASTLEA
jgi:hypothetical protein